MYIKIDQPDAKTERKILELVRNEDMHYEEDKSEQQKLNVEEVLAAGKEALKVHTSDEVVNYLVELIMATRNVAKYDKKLEGFVRFGASPRATIALDKCAKINAWLEGRDFVTPDDITAVVYDVLRHRIILSFEAMAEGVSADDVIRLLLKAVPLP